MQICGVFFLPFIFVYVRFGRQAKAFQKELAHANLVIETLRKTVSTQDSELKLSAQQVHDLKLELEGGGAQLSALRVENEMVSLLMGID